MTQLKDSAMHEVITVAANASIDDVIGLLKKHEVRHVAVIRDGRPVGMVSTGDVLVTVGGLLSEQRVTDQDPTVPYAGPTLVEQIMSTELITVPAEESLATAARVMLDQQVAAVLVVAEETVVGIVTEADYLHRFLDDDSGVPEECRQQSVAAHMATDVVTTDPTANPFTLLREMGNRIHHLPVLEGGKLVGILSDHDVRRALALDKIEQIIEPQQRVRLMDNFDAGRIMTTDIQTTTPTATLAEAARQMIEHKIGVLPVLADGDLAGIISETDIVRACVSALEASS